jgi:hypothetical protein
MQTPQKIKMTYTKQSSISFANPKVHGKYKSSKIL